MTSPGTMSPSTLLVPSQSTSPGWRVGGLALSGESRSEPYPQIWSAAEKVLPDRPVVADDDAERAGVKAGDDPRPERLDVSQFLPHTSVRLRVRCHSRWLTSLPML